MPTNTAEISTLRAQAAAPREASLPVVAPGFGSLQSFELMQRAAKLLSSSTLVPAQYRANITKLDKYGNIKESRENPNALANCVFALNMSNRMGADPLMVMQNLYVVEGRPSWSSQWIIAAINGCGRFSPLRFELKDRGEKTVEYTYTEWVDNQRSTKTAKVKINDMSCTAWAIEKESGEKITSPTVNIEMAVKEGWYTKLGSKWQTMPEVMLRYRTASFFGKLYAPELLMGLQTVEEMQDVVIDATPDGRGVYAVDVESLRASHIAPVNVDTETGEIQANTNEHDADPQDEALKEVETKAAPEKAGRKAASTKDAEKIIVTYAEVAAALEAANNQDDLDLACDLIQHIESTGQREELAAIVKRRLKEFRNPPASGGLDLE